MADFLVLSYRNADLQVGKIGHLFAHCMQKQKEALKLNQWSPVR